MADVPIRSIAISDFRRLTGHRTLPLDAPVVLLHGPNGSGKTSVLSALELGLTGQVRSMQRQDPRYTAYLPSLGEDFATVRVEVSDRLRRGDSPPSPLTVGGSRIDGSSALKPEAANFYGERCYLDQTSLGRLLDLYQYREGKEESALARFVSELLGLEELDALRVGLQDANNLRSLKRLADHLGDAALEAQRADDELTATTGRLTDAKKNVDRARSTANTAAGVLGLNLPKDPSEEDADLVEAIRKVSADDRFELEHRRLMETQRTLVALGGRIDAVTARPSGHEFSDARERLDEAERALRAWGDRDGLAIHDWEREAHAAGVFLDADADLGRMLNQARLQLDLQSELRAQSGAHRASLDAGRERLASLQDRLRDAQEDATALVEGLAFIRPIIADESCPVCDRDYSEVGVGHLGAHVDAKIAQLSQRGERLLELRRERDAAVAENAREEASLLTVEAGMLDSSHLGKLERRAADIERLHEAWQQLRLAAERGRTLRVAEAEARRSIEDFEALSGEEQFVRNELAACAATLGRPFPGDGHSVRAIWEDLSSAAGARLDELNEIAAARKTAAQAAEELDQALQGLAETTALLARAAENKGQWEAHVKEGQRRQAVARKVFDAATEARGRIVQRVFTESLNKVWRSVFTRLAPNESFIPEFGMPAASKTGLELTVQTVHRNGDEGGSPQMMLSAGNLNTAALSLFLALHLAVEPVVPCLVFDDPVQAMDEVHVAQFAGLIRVLAKQHERQVIIAVHERELFDYLAFELSPAYEGDELLTIELGERSLDQDRGITRHVWAPDSAIIG